MMVPEMAKTASSNSNSLAVVSK